MFFVHSNFTVPLKISQAVITNSFAAKFSGWDFCPTPGIDKSDQNRQNTYLAVSWQIMVFVHSNFTNYLRIVQAIITNSFRAKCSGWHFHPTPGIDKSDQNWHNTYLAVSWQIMVFVHSNFTDYLRIAQAIITNSFAAKYSGWNFYPTPGIDKSDQNWQNTYLAVSWQIMVFVHSNFTNYLRIAQAIITNSFRAKCSGWHFHPTPGIDKSDQNWHNTYLAVSWQIMFFVHSNFTDYLRIAQAIITNSFGAKCSGWHFHPTRLLIKMTKLGKTHIWLYLGKEWFLYIQTSQFISKYHKQSLQILLPQSIRDENFAQPRVLTNLTKIGKPHI